MDTLFALTIFINLKAFKGGTSGEKFMAEFAFMFLVGVVVTVDLLVRLLCFVCEGENGSVCLAWVIDHADEGCSYPSQT